MLVKPYKTHDKSVQHDASHYNIFKPAALRHINTNSAKAIKSVTYEDRLWLETIRHNLHLDPGALFIIQEAIETEEVFFQVVSLNYDSYKHVYEE